ncbi:MAG: septal ring lytic transglycosylase RlpA family protein [Aeromonas sp.]
MYLRHTLLPLSLSVLLVACSSQPEPSAPITPALVVQPPVSKPPVIEIPQATGALPRTEPLSADGNHDYWIGQQKYEVWRDIKHYSKEGTANWQSPERDGQKTANGDVRDSKQFTAAHPNLPLPSYVRVTNLANGLETTVRVNDRGPFTGAALITLSQAAANQLGMLNSPTAQVRIELISETPDQEVAIAPMAPIEMTSTVPTSAPTAKPHSQAVQPAPSNVTAPVASPAKLANPANAPASPAKPANATLAPAHNADGKMIQVLASGSPDRAEAMGKVMTQRYGVPYQVVTHDAIYRVLIGPVATAQQASLLEKVRLGGLEKAFIVP